MLHLFPITDADLRKGGGYRMARYIGALCRICRREGEKLFLKGDRCYTEKCAIERRKYPPGQHGQGYRKLSDYGIQLREKQKVKRIYGMTEKQFRLFFTRAARQKGKTGDLLMAMLERRLDNVVFRLGCTNTRTEARQLVRHGHFTVNGKRITTPSQHLRVGDVLAVREGNRTSTLYAGFAERENARPVPSWLSVDINLMKAELTGEPQYNLVETGLDYPTVFEYYSR